MRYIKIPALLAVAATALMALAGTATAASVTSSAGTTPNIVLTSSNSEFDGTFPTVKCEHSKIEFDIESHGGATVGGSVDLLTFTGCNYPVTINSGGSLSMHPVSPTGDATVTSSGLNLTLHVPSPIGPCIITTNGTYIGTLDGKTGAVMNINSAKIPRTGGTFLCGSSVTWTGSYTVASPSTLEVH